jgi:hypothetical protein
MLVVACTPTLPEAPSAPAPPRLSFLGVGDQAPFRERVVTLRAEAEPDSLVSVFPTEGCRGAPLLRGSAEVLDGGVRVDTVYGDNVFSARALGANGQTSACSASITLEVRFYLRSANVRPPSLRELPPLLGRERRIVLKGEADPGATVRVWSDPRCEAVPLAELSVDTFRDPGVVVLIPSNGELRLGLDALLGDSLSFCNPTATFVHDGVAPTIDGGFWFPPPPVASELGLVVVTGVERCDELEGSPRAGCSGPAPVGVRFQSCEGTPGAVRCTCFYGPFESALAPAFSVRAVDRAGNASACLELPQVRDAGPPPPFHWGFVPGTGLLLVARGSAPQLPAVFQDAECRVSVVPSGQTFFGTMGPFAQVLTALQRRAPVFIGRFEGTQLVSCEQVR